MEQAKARTERQKRRLTLALAAALLLLATGGGVAGWWYQQDQQATWRKLWADVQDLVSRTEAEKE